PLTAAYIVAALAEAGAPPGVVNLVFCRPDVAVERLLQASAVRAISFTGSTAVGRVVAQNAAPGLKRLVLELGGHAPVIICRDADLDLAVRTMAAAKFAS